MNNKLMFHNALHACLHLKREVISRCRSTCGIYISSSEKLHKEMSYDTFRLLLCACLDANTFIYQPRGEAMATSKCKNPMEVECHQIVNEVFVDTRFHI